MNIGSLQKLPEQYRPLPFSGADTATMDQIFSSQTNVDWKGLHERKWKQSEGEIPDLETFLEKSLPHSIERLEKALAHQPQKPLYTPVGSLMERYEDLNKAFEEAYSFHTEMDLLTLRSPKGIEAEHLHAIRVALAKRGKSGSLSFQGTGEAMTDQAFQHMLYAIQSLPERSKISFQNIPFSSDQFQELMKELPLSSVDSLQFEECNLSSTEAEQLAAAMKEADALYSTLSLSHNLIGERGMAAFKPLLEEGCLILQVKGIGVDEEFMRTFVQDLEGISTVEY